jgi:N-acetylglucosaminyl-diphospho-decaprenol L-rhamnosyltransferase
VTLDLSVIIVNWNTRDLLERCLRSVYETVSETTFEVIVIDNASSDGSRHMVRERFPQVRILANGENVGFARANNQAAMVSEGRYLLLLNSAALLQAGTVQALRDLAKTQPYAGVTGAQLRNPDGSFQASHSPFPTLWREILILSGLGRWLFGRQYPSHGPDENRGPQEVDYVEGACLLVRHEAYTAVGGLDEGYFMYAEDVDLCRTMRQQGWQVWYQPAAVVTHLGGGSSASRRPEREADLYASRVRFFRKHYGPFAAWLLVTLILGTTATKTVVHGMLRSVSRGRYGRQVVTLRHLVGKLRGA